MVFVALSIEICSKYYTAFSTELTGETDRPTDESKIIQ